MSKYKLPKIKDLFEAGVHFGHQVRRWNPNMEPYIYTVKGNIHIIDLEQTEDLLKKACEFLYETAKKGGRIVFVGTKRQASELVKLEAEKCGACYVTQRWLGGTITNFRVIRKNIDKYVNHLKKREAGEYEKYTKKERLLIDREIEKLENSLGGLVNLKGTPDALFIVDARREKTAVREARRYGVPVVALIDTNSDPTGIEYVVPGNDDAIKSIVLVLQSISDAISAGYKEHTKKADTPEKEEEKGEVSSEKDASKAENSQEKKDSSEDKKKKPVSTKKESKKLNQEKK